MVKIIELFHRLQLNLNISFDFEIAGFGDDQSTVSNIIGYCNDKKYIHTILQNNYFSLILCPQDIDTAQDSRLVCVDNPESLFYTLYIAWQKQTLHHPENVIHSSAVLDDSTHIAKQGVVIGKRTKIGKNVVIHSGVHIGENCQIGDNCRLGGDGFMIKEINGLNTLIPHDGKLIIEDNVQIGACCNIDKGLLTHDTVIGFNTCMDSHIHVGHSCHIGEKNIITAGVIIGGFVVTKENIFIGINSSIKHKITIGESAFIGIGSCVTRNILSHQKVFGNPARCIVIK